jgi:O-antigen/teichoic acid export membrane protein
VGSSEPSMKRVLDAIPVRALACAVLGHFCLWGSILVLTSALGRGRYGAFAFALGLQSYLFLVGCLGIKPVVIREYVRYPRDGDKTYTSHFILTGGSSVLVALLCISVVLASPLPFDEQALITLLALGNIAACINIQVLFDASRKQRLSLAITAGTEAACLMSLLLFWQVGWLTLLAAGAIMAAKWTANTILHYATFGCCVRRPRWRPCLTTTWRIVRAAIPLLFSGLVAGLPLSAGVLIVRIHQGTDAAAVVGLGQQGASGFVLLTAFAFRYLQPTILGPQGSLADSSRVASGLFAAGLTAALVLAMTGAVAVVRWLLPPAYRDGWLPVVLFLVAGYQSCLGSLLSIHLIAHHQERAILLANALAATAYVAGAWLIVPLLGPTGAALASVAAGMLALAVMGQRIQRVRHRGEQTAEGRPVLLPSLGERQE